MTKKDGASQVPSFFHNASYIFFLIVYHVPFRTFQHFLLRHNV